MCGCQVEQGCDTHRGGGSAFDTVVGGGRDDGGDFKLATVTADKLWASLTLGQVGAADLLTGSGEPFVGVALAPDSDIRAVMLYVDGSALGIPLGMGAVLPVKIGSRLQAETLTPTPQWNGNADDFTDINGAAVLLCPQVLKVRLYRKLPPDGAMVFQYPTIATYRTKLLKASAPRASVNLLALYLPGLTYAQLGASNENNNSNAGVAVTVDVIDARGEVPADQGTRYPHSYAAPTPGVKAITNGITVPQVADSKNPVEGAFSTALAGSAGQSAGTFFQTYFQLKFAGQAAQQVWLCLFVRCVFAQGV